MDEFIFVIEGLLNEFRSPKQLPLTHELDGESKGEGEGKGKGNVQGKGMMGTVG